MSDLSADRWENKRLSWASPSHVRAITLPRIAFRRRWTHEGEPAVWGVTGALVPHAIRHRRGRFVQQTALKLELLLADRHRLDDPLWRGDVKLHEAMPHLLRRRWKRHGATKTARLNKRGAPIYRPFRLSADQLARNQEAAEKNPHDGRRPELLLNVGRVVMVFAACSHYKTGFLTDPHRPGFPMSLAKIAEMAGESYAAAKDALDWLELWGYIDFTKRNVERRPELRPDGTTRWRHRTMRPSWRRFRWDRWLEAFGGKLYREAFETAGTTGKQKRKLAQAPKPDEAPPDPRVVAAAQMLGKWFRPAPAKRRTGYDTLDREARFALVNAIKLEHPAWEMPELIAEARRRCAAPPNVAGATEPETSDSAE